ncbi:MAG: carboxypeptidase regulatory-like domain-containing protein, partial [Opitutaceae bacterium]
MNRKPTTRPAPPSKTTAWIGSLLIAACAGVATGLVHAAPAAATGAVSGRVQSEVTGQYLLNVRVTVEGTALEAFTDAYGTFRLAQVPAGRTTLVAFYSGLDSRRITLDVAPGQTLEQIFNLTSRAVAAEQSGVVRLDPFVLAAAKVREGEALATNEQRFAPNIKNFVSTDAFGDVPEG